MKTKLNLLTAGICLAVANASFGQATIQFTAATFTVAENACLATLTLQRTGDTDTEVSVDYTTANGTATAGLDYTATNGTLTFLADETNRTLTIPILNDGLVEASYETFTVTLSNPTNAVLGTPTTATVRITENDKGLQLEYGSYRVGEAEGFILLGVARGDDGNFPVSVDFATSDSTATNGVDYMATNGTLSFAPGQKVALLTVPILNDGLKESSETFRVTLSNPTNQVLGLQKTVTVTIVDNDAGVQFQPFNQYWIAENEGALTLTVVRGNDSNLAPMTVDYAFTDLTASNGLDYLGTNGTLSFAQDELVKTLTIPILYDELPEADEQSKVTLSNPTNAVLGPYATATITILDTTGMAAHRFGGVSVLPDRSVQLTLEGGVHMRFRDYYDLYPIEVSSNLVDWTPLVTLQRTNASTNVLSYTDASAVNADCRYYRMPTNHLLTPWLKPTGPYPVGSITRFVFDPTRRNRYNVSTNNAIPVLVVYPAVAEPGRLPTWGLDPRLFNDPTIGGTFMDFLHYFLPHWLPGAPCATNQSPYPVVLYSPGRNGGAWAPADQASNLASHGYVVVSIEPGDSRRSVLPDGSYVTMPEQPPIVAAATQDRVRDLVIVLNELTRWNTNNSQFAGRLDLTQVAAVGGSWGGVTSAEFGRIDSRCIAVIPLDPGGLNSTPELTQLGVGKPLLEIVSGDIADTSLYYQATYDAIWFLVSGADHLNVAGADWYWFFHPEILSAGMESERTINAYTLWFLNKYLKGDAVPPAPLPGFPLVTGFMQK